jgi:hypothetical protein
MRTDCLTPSRRAFAFAGYRWSYATAWRFR